MERTLTNEYIVVLIFSIYLVPQTQKLVVGNLEFGQGGMLMCSRPYISTWLFFSTCSWISISSMACSRSCKETLLMLNLANYHTSKYTCLLETWASFHFQVSTYWLCFLSFLLRSSLSFSCLNIFTHSPTFTGFPFCCFPFHVFYCLFLLKLFLSVSGQCCVCVILHNHSFLLTRPSDQKPVATFTVILRSLEWAVP